MSHVAADSTRRIWKVLWKAHKISRNHQTLHTQWFCHKWAIIDSNLRGHMILFSTLEWADKASPWSRQQKRCIVRRRTWHVAGTLCPWFPWECPRGRPQTDFHYTIQNFISATISMFPGPGVDAAGESRNVWRQQKALRPSVWSWRALSQQTPERRDKARLFLLTHLYSDIQSGHMLVEKGIASHVCPELIWGNFAWQKMNEWKLKIKYWKICIKESNKSSSWKVTQLN